MTSITATQARTAPRLHAVKSANSSAAAPKKSWKMVLHRIVEIWGAPYADGFTPPF